METTKKWFKELLPYIIIIAVVIIIRSFLISPIQVDGKSMDPTLKDGQVLLLNKIELKTRGIKRFDIVVIDHPLNPQDKYLIKRVVGLPNEKIAYRDGTLYVNDKEIKEPFLNQTTQDFELDELGVTKVPKDSYFVVGDNRSNSADSRYIGFIPKDEIKGITNFRLFPFNQFGKIQK